MQGRRQGWRPLFPGGLFRGFVGAEVTDLAKPPFGLDLPTGAFCGAGTVVLCDGVKVLEVPFRRGCLGRCILFGIAPCTSVFLARGNVTGSLAWGRWWGLDNAGG